MHEGVSKSLVLKLVSRSQRDVEQPSKPMNLGSSYIGWFKVSLYWALPLKFYSAWFGSMKIWSPIYYQIEPKGELSEHTLHVWLQHVSFWGSETLVILRAPTYMFTCFGVRHHLPNGGLLNGWKMIPSSWKKMSVEIPSKPDDILSDLKASLMFGVPCVRNIPKQKTRNRSGYQGFRNCQCGETWKGKLEVAMISDDDSPFKANLTSPSTIRIRPHWHASLQTVPCDMVMGTQWRTWKSVRPIIPRPKNVQTLEYTHQHRHIEAVIILIARKYMKLQPSVM